MGKDAYEEKVRAELKAWGRQNLKPPGLWERASKGMQAKINDMIPDKVHTLLTATVKGLVKTVLFGLEFVPKNAPAQGLSLAERDRWALNLLSDYKKIAAAEGAGTGAGGFVLGMADFPALMAIKMKFLFELAHVYGFSTQDYHERLFLLYVFQLAFSSQEQKPNLYHAIAHWEETVEKWPSGTKYLEQIDWEKFQREYRDTIDLRKMLQMLPGVGAVVGAWANYGLLEELGQVGMNCYRLRLLPVEERVHE
ncbi:EcsC family protein [Paradesulfitobacterium ferrireducens]|uniref:EcsC family protein n=1 Tax=Paradesulfitobacterium ferrireducens TaxID=2816476 RepID=UPI001F359F8C|nr:EcsC family protein [Paradesulfitobacterium ferrireducens]